MDDPKRTPEPSFGPDEEGEIPLAPDDVTDKPPAWVHVENADTSPERDDQ